tara:strand:- start:1531 stop:2301 length:771 start_codon:yes stop_codon:yes gene_type:complete
MSYKTRDISQIWKDIEGYSGYYQVSNDGEVRSLDREIVHKNGHSIVRKGKSLNKYKCSKGYYRVELSKHGTRKKMLVHRLVAQAFISNPNKKPCVNHKNGIKTDNNISNLEWCSYSENTKHALASGLMEPRKGSDCNFSVISENDVRSILDMLRTKEYTQNEIASMFNIKKATVSAINTGKNWSSVSKKVKKSNLRDKPVRNCRGEEFKSITEASKKFNIHKSGIIKNCSGIQKSAGKYKDGTRVVWAYLNIVMEP